MKSSVYLLLITYLYLYFFAKVIHLSSYFAFWEYENDFLDGWLNVHDSSCYQTLAKGREKGGGNS